MSATILINCNHGSEDAERATLPFVIGNVSASADQKTIVFLTIEGVRLATKGYADSIHEGARITTAANLVEQVVNEATVVSV